MTDGRRARRKPVAENLREWRGIRPESRAMRSRESAGGRRWLMNIPRGLVVRKNHALLED